MYRIEHYRTAAGIDVFGEWFDRLRESQARARIALRLDRLTLGLVGDAKMLRDGVSELRVDQGPGYRVYFARDGRSMVLLLCGGVKGSQAADIARAVRYWREFQERK